MYLLVFKCYFATENEINTKLHLNKWTKSPTPKQICSYLVFACGLITSVLISSQGRNTVQAGFLFLLSGAVFLHRSSHRVKTVKSKNVNFISYTSIFLLNGYVLDSLVAKLKK